MSGMALGLVLFGFVLIFLGYVIFYFGQIYEAQFYLPTAGVALILIGLVIHLFSRRW
jgi:uncharacterized membrane protein